MVNLWLTKFFAAHGIDIVDTDEIAHELTLPGGKAMSLIKKTFGTSFITKDGSLDRGKIRKLVFSNPIFKNQLEAILHPLIYQEVVRRIQFSDFCLYSHCCAITVGSKGFSRTSP